MKNIGGPSRHTLCITAMSKGSIITLAVLVVLVLGGVFAWKQTQRSYAEKEAPRMVLDLLGPTKAYRDHKDYVDGLIRTNHDRAFREAYRSGGLVAQSVWDEQKYLELTIDFIRERATAEGKADLVEGLISVSGKPEGHKEKVLFGGNENF